jgi:hypothetical protein
LGLARIAIAVLAVVLAFGLLVVGGVALWGALTGKEDPKPNAATPAPSSTAKTKTSKTSAPPSGQSQSQSGNTIQVRCLVAPCAVFVSGPGPNDIQFNGTLTMNEIRIFNGTRLTMAVQDAGGVAVTINGRAQERGRRGEARMYEAP